MPGENDPKQPEEPQQPNKPADPKPQETPPASPPAGEPSAQLLEAERKRNEALRVEIEALKKDKQAREQKEADAERIRLEEQGKFKELAESERARAAEARAAAEEARKQADEIVIDSEIRIALIREGANDADIASLVPRGDISVVGGRVRGVEDVIKKFKEEKPHFFGEPRPGATSSRRTTPPPETDSNKGGTKDVRKLAPADYAKYKAETLSKIRRREAIGG